MSAFFKKKIAIIGTVGIPAKYGGFETLAEYLTQNLNQKLDITVYCSKKPFAKVRNQTYNNSRLIFLPLKANGPQSVIYDIFSIIHAFFKNDVLLVLGVSGSIMFPILKLFGNRKIVVNIDGIEHKREKWSHAAKRYLSFTEKIAIKHADTIIADNEGIKEYIKSKYNKEPALIAYGGDHVFYEKLTRKVRVDYNLPEKYALKVCRIEPENNIEMILNAFSAFNVYPIVIIGNWKNSNYGLKLFNKYKSHKNLKLINPIYDQRELNEIRSNCYIYIHGHSAGGTNPSLVEAMYLKLPVIAFDVNFNRYTTSNEAEYFKTKDQLVDILNSLLPERIKRNAINMYQIAQNNYRWEKISDQYNELF